MLEDLKRSEANRKSHVCPEQPLAHLFTKNEPAEPKRIPWESMAQYTDKRDLISEMGYAPAVG